MTTNTNIGNTTKPASRGTETRPTTDRRPDPSTPFRVGKTPTHEQIATRARALWEAKGRPSGQDVQNWTEAEAQLRAETRTP